MADDNNDDKPLTPEEKAAEIRRIADEKGLDGMLDALGFPPLPPSLAEKAAEASLEDVLHLGLSVTRECLMDALDLCRRVQARCGDCREAGKLCTFCREDTEILMRILTATAALGRFAGLVNQPGTRFFAAKEAAAEAERRASEKPKD